MEKRILEKPKEIKDFIGLFNRINQLFKTRYNSLHEKYTQYSIKNGKIISFSKNALSHVTADIIFTKYEEKFRDSFNELELYVNGLKYYKFMQEYKSNVSSIELSDSGILFKTNIPEVELQIEPLSVNNDDIKQYSTLRKEGMLKFVKPSNLFEEMNLDSDTVMEILDTNAPYILNLSEVKIRLTHRVLFGAAVKSKTSTKNKVKTTTKITSNIRVKVYETDAEDIYVIKIEIDNSEMKNAMKLNNYFAIVNYE